MGTGWIHVAGGLADALRFPFFVLVFGIAIKSWEGDPLGDRSDTPAHTLVQVARPIVEQLTQLGVDYWILPGAGLIDLQGDGEFSLSIRRKGLPLAVWHSDVQVILTVIPALDKAGYDAVETFFGLRIFPRDGYGSDDLRFDYRFPFVDLFYYKRQDSDPGPAGQLRSYLVNFCCDCGRLVVSGCTKKTCGCQICVSDYDDIFPLGSVVLDGLKLKSPALRQLIELPQQWSMSNDTNPNPRLLRHFYSLSELKSTS